ncbi:ABC-2 type transport system permease protein [Nocardioides daedukensis]|uniref:Transport permease protein n=1 Tax=Nocardioides daedukensis TaxID=634462 RepID=A0A7Y9S0Z9_9ACTN|nr:ABC transporter permease [Nocardioides daedukensis]NYG60337.1 ABC-2 type transport system permease protein [Nocardioides daedukensis]
MRAFKAVAVAILKGFIRDKASVFFSIVFPLMFLVLFGGILTNTDASEIETRTIGEVALIDDMPEGAREAFDEAFDVTETDDRDAAIAAVRKGDLDLALEQDGDTLIAHYTQTDQVKAAMVNGLLRAFVDSTNIAVTGQQPKFDLRPERVEDDSMKMIDFVTPGLLGWAIAMSAAFGAAATLNGWRQSRLLRRIQLSPVPPTTVVGARIATTMMIALVQTAIFLGLGTVGFGLTLTGSWWMAVPLVLCGTLAFMAIGLLSGAVAKTTEGAVNMANFLVLPMAFLSGSFFPLDGAPTWLQTISKVMPLRHLNDGMLDVMVRGEGPGAAVVPMLILLAFAAVLTAIAAKMFRWDA